MIASGNKLTGIKKYFSFGRLISGLRFEFNGANGWWYEFQLKIARALVFKKWQEGVGGKLKVIASRAARHCNLVCREYSGRPVFRCWKDMGLRKHLLLFL